MPKNKPTKTRKFFLTTFTVEVLSEDNNLTDLNLHELAYASEDDCVAKTTAESRELTEEQTVELLYEFGSEPGFFQLEEPDANLPTS